MMMMRKEERLVAKKEKNRASNFRLQNNDSIMKHEGGLGLCLQLGHQSVSGNQRKSSRRKRKYHKNKAKSEKHKTKQFKSSKKKREKTLVAC